MSIRDEQTQLSEALLHGKQMADTVKAAALESGFGWFVQSRLIMHLERKEFTGIASGYHLDHQYPDNRQVFDGQNMVTNEGGLETINNSETAGQLG